MRLYEGGGEVSRLAVEIADLELAGTGILAQAREADALASSIAAVQTGCLPLDEALDGWVHAWGTQLAVLSALSVSLAITLGAAARGYSETDGSIAAAFG